MKPNEQSEFGVVRGIVLPTVWSATGEPRQVAILTPDEREYNVAPVLAGEALLSHLREEVEARILVKADQKDGKTITVVSFTVVGVSDQDGDEQETSFANNADKPDRGFPDPLGG
jgi:hypothetical protein